MLQEHEESKFAKLHQTGGQGDLLLDERRVRLEGIFDSIATGRSAILLERKPELYSVLESRY